jgi:DNA polymerase I-like protein with 3'-5' exonuclease and polymerase domains
MDQLYAFQMENWLLSRSLMLRGISFDTKHQAELRLTLMEEASGLSQWLLDVLPERFRYAPSGKEWFTSPKATAFILYDLLGLKPVLHKKTRKPTTDDTALQELGESNPWLSPLLNRLRHLRSLGVFTSNFLEARTSADGRMRCSFNIAHPETFRWSSNSNGFGEGTNLQNIPTGEE